MQKIKQLFLTTTLAILTVGVVPGELEAKPPSSSKVVGTYKLSISHPMARAKVNGRIDKAIEDMNFIKRPIARSILRSNTMICKTIIFSLKNGKFSSTCDHVGPHVSPASGKRAKVTFKGDEIQVSHVVKPQQVKQVFFSDDGVRTNIFKVTKSNKTMTVSVRIVSEDLPEPLTYKLTYTRVR